MSQNKKLKPVVNDELYRDEWVNPYGMPVGKADGFIELCDVLDVSPVDLYDSSLEWGSDIIRKDSLGGVTNKRIQKYSLHCFPTLLDWLLNQAGLKVPQLCELSCVTESTVKKELRENNVVGREYILDGGISWTRVREKVIERDDGECQMCFEELVEDKRHVHHVIPKKFFDKEEVAHDSSNLVLLCPKHHKSVEGYSPQELFKMSKGELTMPW